MKLILTSLLVSLFTILSSQAGSDEENSPANHKDAILKSQCIFVGKMKVTDYLFFDDEGRIVPDKEGKMSKAMETDRFKSEVSLPMMVRRWADLSATKPLLGKTAHFQPALKLAWNDHTMSACPHHALALDGSERIWVLVFQGKDKAPDWVSLPLRHLDEVKKMRGLK